MRPQPPPRRKSSAGTIIAVVFTVGFLFFGLFLLAVGVLVFARTGNHQAHAMAREAMARAQVERVRAEAEVHRGHLHPQEQLAEAHRGHVIAQEQLAEAVNHPGMVVESEAVKDVAEPIRVANRQITLQVDEEGKIKMDGRAVEQKQLAMMLRHARKGRESALSVTIKADKKCLFEHVASVLSVCQELDIPNVSIAAE